MNPRMRVCVRARVRVCAPKADCSQHILKIDDPMHILKIDGPMRAYLQQVHKPLDIRSKTTRALRRKLSPADASKLTVKGKKKATHFPVRKFAVKA